MKLKIIESVWNNRIYSEAKKLRKAVALYKFEDIKDAAIKLYDKAATFFTREVEQIIRDKINELRAEWEDFDVNSYIDEEDKYDTDLLESKLDELLSKLYDFCDEHRIWLSIE